ncbi:MAG TPA: hypothetical protein VMJ93_05415 [Verrucomicrobiae bacterium]|nr:hypothetical protein [Verrucomicrobiae bacterium]
MPDDNPTNNPYKPQQPRIPGVSEAMQRSSRAGDAAPGGNPGLLAGIGVAVVFLVVIVFAIGHWMFRKAVAKPPERAASAPAAKSEPAPERPVEQILIGPGPIATKEDLAKVWSSKRFDFRDAAAGTIIQALAVHLPGNVYWGFSLREPYGTCTLQYISDLNELQSSYNFTSSYPLVADPCNQSLFDLTKYGSGPTGLVRGQIVQGNAVRPPVAIELRVKGNDIVAVRLE